MSNLGTILGIPPAAAPAWVALTVALDRMADQGRTPVCVRRPDDWASEAPTRARRAAAEACGHCPVMRACAAYADVAGERCHVWGGIDRTPPPKRREAAA